MKQTVLSVAQYRVNALYESDTREPMLLCQYQFPVASFDDDQDVMFAGHIATGHSTNDLSRSRRKHFRDFINCEPTFPMFGRLFEEWVRTRSVDPDRKIKALIKMTSADSKVTWTGFRISGWVGDKNQTVFRIELFAKHPSSETVVSSQR